MYGKSEPSPLRETLRFDTMAICEHDAVQSSFAMCPQMDPILSRIATHRKSRAMRALRLKHLVDSGRPYRSEFEPLARLVASRRRAGVSRSRPALPRSCTAQTS